MTPPIRKAIVDFLRVVGKFILFGIITMLVGFGCTLLCFLFIPQEAMLASMTSELSMDNIWYNNLYYTCIVVGQLVAFGVLYRLEKKTFWALGLHPKHFFPQFWQGAVLGVLLITIIFGVLFFLGLVQVVSFDFQPTVLGAFLVFFILISLTEELVFRTLSIQLLGDTYGKIVALVISSLFFTFVHYSNPSFGVIPLFTIFLGGLLLGILYLKTEQLWAPIGFHLTWNYFQGNIYGFEVSGLRSTSLLQVSKVGDSLWTGGDFGMEGSILSVVVLWACLFFYKKDIQKWIFPAKVA